MAQKSQRQKIREHDVTENVREIFAMFDALQRSYDALADKSGIAESRITFRGFDANDETEGEYLRASRVMAMMRGIQDANSHFPALRGYEKMLHEWHNSPDEENLTKEDILRIINV